MPVWGMSRAVHWVGTSLEDIRAFPAEARRAIGHQLHLVQMGLEPADWRPMPSVGPGVREIHVHGDVERRVLYLTRLGKALYVLHAFEKKTARTSRTDIALGRRRLRAALATVRAEGRRSGRGHT